MLFVKRENIGCLFGIAGIMLCTVSAADAQTIVDVTTADELQSVGSQQNNTTLELQNDIQLTTNKLYIESKKDITIDGQGHAIEAASGGTQWQINNSKNFTFKNVIFADSKKPDAGGIIKSTVKSTINLENFTVRNITVNDISKPVWGGIIEFSNNSYLSISDSLFEKINIESNNASGEDVVTGSVLYVQGDEGTHAGASVVTLIKNTKFNNNSLTSLGAKNAYGGAIYVEGRIDEISNSIFEGNSAQATQDGVTAYGGAIAGGGITTWEYARRGAATIGTIGDKTQFNQNFVKSAGKGYGGAIYSSGLISSFVGTQFNGNYVLAENAYGGAIASTTSSGEKVCNPSDANECVIIDPANIALIRRAVFDGNYASATNTAQGGAIYSGGNSDIVTGFFYNNHADGIEKAEGGAIYNSAGKMKNAAGEFVDKVARYYSGEFNGNYVKGNLAHGGALYNEGIIQNIKKIPGYDNALNANFVGNYALADNMAVGGGIYNNGKIEMIEATLKGNYTVGVNEARGGGLANTLRGRIGTIVNTNFMDNAAIATGENSVARGGAIFNNGEDATEGDLDIASIGANFTNNYASAVNAAYGGAVHNRGVLGNVVAHFVKNVATSVHSAFGGAVHNVGTAGDIDSDFTDNHAVATAADGTAKGGAVYNDGTITSIGGGNKISSIFSQNYVSATGEAFGGAIYNEAMLGNIKADFSDNYADGDTAMGGAIYTKTAASSTISGTFKNNKTIGKTSAFGGAVWAVSDSLDKPIEFVNSVFTDNRAELSAANSARAANQALGGAVFGNALKFTAKGQGEETKFKGNTAGDTKNAIYVAGLNSVGMGDGTDAKVEFAAVEGGKVSVYDDVDGVNYDMHISGDGSTGVDTNISGDSSKVVLYGTVNNVNNLSLGAKSLTRLVGTINAKNYSASTDSIMHLGQKAAINLAENYTGGGILMLDLDVEAENKNGLITVDGNVNGTTQVIVNSLKDAKLDNMITKFLAAPNDTVMSDNAFKVARVLGSSYAWEAKRNADNETTGSNWYLVIDEKNDNPVNPPVNPDDDDPNKPVNPVYEAEIAAYTGLQTIAVEQNRSIADSVARGLAAKKSPLCYQESCGIAELFPKKQAWFNVTYENAEIDAPADMDAKISGTTLGLDFYRLGAKRAGLFAAYRHGKYDLSGKGKYYFKTGADVTNKSWLGGAYYQYDDTEWQLLSTIFAGEQDMDIKSDDHLVSASTDAKQYGASVEATKRFALTDTVSLSPSLGLYYTALDIDTLHDNARKQAKFDTLHYLQAEFGAALEYVFCHDGETRRIYVKPSVIRTFESGGKTRMGDIDKPFDTFDERTLGRMEVGGEFGINDRWNGSAEVGYTFGDNYKAYDFTLGLGYKF